MEDLTRTDASDYGAVCEFMVYLADSPFIITAFAVKFSCGVMGALLLVAVFVFLRENRNLHRNANAILFAHYAFTLVAACAVAFNDGFDLFRLTLFRRKHLEDQHDCGIFSMPASIGVWCRLLTFCSNAGSCLTITALAVERSYATFYAKTYEKRGNKHLGLVLNTICVVLCLANAAYIAPAANFRRHLPMQSLTPEAVTRTANAADALLGIEFFNAIIFAILLLLNYVWKRHSSRIFATLTHKYQRKENMSSVSTLLPLAILHLTISISSFLLTEIGSRHVTTNQEVLEVVITRDCFPLYLFLLPVYTLGHVYKRRRVADIERRKRHVDKRHGGAPLEQDGHFEMLKNMFEAKYDRRS